MKVAKWGNSLAVRLPAAVVEALQLQNGDEIEILAEGQRIMTVDEAIAMLVAEATPPDLRST